MKNKVLLIAVILLCCFNFTVSGNDGKKKTDVTKNELEKYVAKKVLSIKTIKSDFKQEKILSFLSKTVVSGGKFVFEKNISGNKVKWEYTTPFKYIIIIDGSKIFMKDSEKITSFDMSTSKVFEEINRIMIGSLNGTILSDKENFMFSIEKKERELFVMMTPKNESEIAKYFKTIEMIMDKNDFTVSRLSMIEQSGDRTDLLFTGKKINGNIDQSEFKVE